MQRDREFAQYCTEFQTYVADIKWNMHTQMDALRNGHSNELQDSVQPAHMPDNIVDFVKMYSKWDSQI
jgi:hypothetical protein